MTSLYAKQDYEYSGDTKASFRAEVYQGNNRVGDEGTPYPVIEVVLEFGFKDHFSTDMQIWTAELGSSDQSGVWCAIGFGFEGMTDNEDYFVCYVLNKI